jgi:hypothetical protein
MLNSINVARLKKKKLEKIHLLTRILVQQAHQALLVPGAISKIWVSENGGLMGIEW